MHFVRKRPEFLHHLVHKLFGKAGGTEPFSEESENLRYYCYTPLKPLPAL